MDSVDDLHYNFLWRYKMAMSETRKKLRKKLWSKSQICFACQKTILSIKEASIEHIVPKSLGGTYKQRNLSLSHKDCNQIRGAIICRIVWELKIKKTGSHKT